mmetsp:Transcript_22687/g.33501  ORF Transcript_22687/g.33501 Transcript_22687/m.33501 type:complete len:314 (-) Transcript_22687:124-1065(-)|eukprot:CAMPEP_0194201252 /NCGR_PEP_ID=MMETSP0156-20130528/1560_1 /TAXON_ID=33649 /ORGANISM="Thalassionema nitzschioides, Strain L26-B" /LENGTH=313 /DNA_ID=CAMNT_0038926385 /DNA_START=47 /DNA_END=988 /DNA_ORIENTATION=-
MVRYSKLRSVSKKGSTKKRSQNISPEDDDDDGFIDVELAEAKKRRNQIKRRIYGKNTDRDFKDNPQDTIGLYRTISRCAVYTIAFLILYSCKQIIDETLGMIFVKKEVAVSGKLIQTIKSDENILNSDLKSTNSSLTKNQTAVNKTESAMNLPVEKASIVDNSNTTAVVLEVIENEHMAQADEQDQHEGNTPSYQLQPFLSNPNSFQNPDLLQTDNPFLTQFSQPGTNFQQLPNLLSTMNQGNLPLSQIPLQPLSSQLTNPFAFQMNPMQTLLSNPVPNQFGNSLQTEPLLGAQPGTLQLPLLQQMPPISLLP